MHTYMYMHPRPDSCKAGATCVTTNSGEISFAIVVAVSRLLVDQNFHCPEAHSHSVGRIRTGVMPKSRHVTRVRVY